MRVEHTPRGHFPHGDSRVAYDHCGIRLCGKVTAVLCLSLVLLPLFAVAQPSPEYRQEVVVVQFAPEIPVSNKVSSIGLQAFDQKAAQYGVHMIERVYPFLDYVQPTPETRSNLMALRRTYYVRYGANATPNNVADDLASVQGVVYAEPLFMYRTQTTRETTDPDDPRFGEQTELNALRLPEAWQYVKGEDGSPRVVIAIVDTGVDWRHEDLRANVWTNQGEIAGNGIDDDGNGFIDDVHGINLENLNELDNDPQPRSGLGDYNHGTFVAGAAGAVTNNGVGIAGASWNAVIMSINAGCGSGWDVCYGLEGILYAAVNGASIVVAGWVTRIENEDHLRFIDQSLTLATQMGALVVVSAGQNSSGRNQYNNDENIVYPANHPRVLSVGATTKDHPPYRAHWSNYGKRVNVFAPGIDILATTASDGYVEKSGTSMSTTLVAGVAALVKTGFPGMGPDALREHIRLTSESIDSYNPQLAGQLGNGLVNALAAVQELVVPAVRLKRWELVDANGDHAITSGERVTIKATFINYLADAQQLSVGLAEAEPYSFIDLTAAEVRVGALTSGDSVEVSFEFVVANNSPVSQPVHFNTVIRDGAFEDGADRISFTINHSLEVVHRSLSALYTATDGDNWYHNDNWDHTTVPTSTQLGFWHGVTVREGLLVELGLDYNNLTGVLPAGLDGLENLESLYLAGNSLSGPIPPDLGNLSKLEGLVLGYNSLTGSIPPELEKLTQLDGLWLGNNSLTGPIPPELANLTQLRDVALSDNSLTGLIPPELGNLSELDRLDLSENSLEGPIPPELGNLRSLRYLWLDGNSLSGEVPPELGNLSRLRRLDLSGNILTGALPWSLLQLDLLTDFRFGGQDLCAPADDTYQDWLSNIPLVDGPTCAPGIGSSPNVSEEIHQSLSALYTATNGDDWAHNDNWDITTVPTEYQLSTWYGVEQDSGKVLKLELPNNNLVGQLPSEIGDLTQLKSLSLHGNWLSGTIPPEIGNLTQLKSLTLHRSSLRGPIPPEIGNLIRLETLTLHGYLLSGPIPPEIGNLRQLKSLTLHRNSLNGPIPREIGNLKQLESLTLHQNSLSGEVPPELGNLSRLRTLDLSDNALTGALPTSLLQLDLTELRFGGQELCAPDDDAYQDWLSNISLVDGPTCVYGPKISEEVHQSLTALYTATKGDNWTRNDNWDITTVPTEFEFATWYGVEQDSGKVLRLELPQNNLVGQLPPEIGNLTQLRFLDLHGNSLSGRIPAEIGNLSQLESLELQENSLSGLIPPEIGSLTGLKSLPLNRNSFSGPIPAEIGNLTQLESLDLSRNSLTGTIPLELGNLSRLSSLNLSGNSLRGSIPQELFDLLQLSKLDLSSNSLSGLIPSKIGDLSELSDLRLSDNSLTGPIAPDFGRLLQLRTLDLSRNQLSGPLQRSLGRLSQLISLDLSWNNLSGTIPPELGSLSKLRALRLYLNSLTGTIPLELANLSELGTLNLYSNTLTGTIPPELGSLSQLGRLDLGSNSLTGTIPPELANLLELYTLDLSNNSLIGSIPPELGRLSQLSYLRLERNFLTGTIPPELFSLSELQGLYLSRNLIRGSIQSEFGTLSKLRHLTLGGYPPSDSMSGIGLSGTIPPELGKLSELSVLSLSYGSLTGSIPPEFGDLSNLITLELKENSLTGAIPSELGNLSDLWYLDLSSNSLTGSIPSELGDLSELKRMWVNSNKLTGQLPRSFTDLVNLDIISFGGQSLCAPADDTFRAWLNSLLMYQGPFCTGLHFSDAISNQAFLVFQPVTPFVLPYAIGGTSPISYALLPSLPAGLTFDASTRTITGIPTEVTAGPVPYTYTAVDATGDADSTMFQIEVFAPADTEHDAVPESFVAHGNYPNPFRESTRLVFDLPWPALVSIEVADLTGRHLFTVPSVNLSRGTNHMIEISGATLPSGLFLYRLIAVSPEGSTALTGRFVHVR